MLTTNYLVPAFAVLGLVAGQSSSTICSQPTTTINSQGDASSLASACSTYTGSIVVASSVSGVISFDGLSEIEGGISVTGAANLTSLSAKDLTTITGDFTLDSCIFLSTLGFPLLKDVANIIWSHLPSLQVLGFTAGVTNSTSILITDTQLGNIDSINPTSPDLVNINNNNYLDSWSPQITVIPSLLNMGSNSPNMKVGFPDLLSAGNMTFRNISSISMPLLSSVNGTLGFYGDYLTNISCPNITHAGVLAIIANPNLVNISMPQLTKVSDALQIANNSALGEIYFPALTTTGSVDATGNFSSALLPALKDDRGAFHMLSSGDIDCSHFASLKSSMYIQGSYTCEGKSTDVQPGSGTGSGTSTGTSSSASSTSTKGAASIAKADMDLVIGLFALIGGLLQLLP